MSFSRENFTGTKVQKSTKSIKSKQVTFTQMFFTRIKSIKSRQVTFTQMFFYTHKKHKKHKKHKNVKQATFFFLDVFYANKKHKSANKQIGDFLPRRCFLSAFKNVIFVYVRLIAFLCFYVRVESFRKKGSKLP